MASGLHARGRLDASPRPVCAPGRDSRAGHLRHNGLSVTPIRLRLAACWEKILRMPAEAHERVRLANKLPAADVQKLVEITKVLIENEGRAS